MAATVADQHETPERFPSMDEFRLEHARLLKRHREPGTTPLPPKEITQFLRGGIATGAILDEDEDRWSAQSLLDY